MQSYSLIITLSLVLISSSSIVRAQAQTPQEKYEAFKKQSVQTYGDFRRKVNHEYAEFMRKAWLLYNNEKPVPIPKEDNSVPPIPYEEDKEEKQEDVVVSPIKEEPVQPEVIPQPLPIEPIKEIPQPGVTPFKSDFYGIECAIRLPKTKQISLNDISPEEIANAWEKLSNSDMDNAIRDCLEMRIRYNLCDWAYLSMLDKIAHDWSQDQNVGTLLMAFIFCQSGYQMRLAKDDSRLLMLYGSKHLIYNKTYFRIDGENFYPYGTPSKSVNICNAKYMGETPMSLIISAEQSLGNEMSDVRDIKSKRYSDVEINSQVPKNLIKFFDQYPTSAIGDNIMTRWAMYANTPLAQKTKDTVYPELMKSIEGCSAELSANKLLNFVQTGFVYEYDDKVWGHDRAFFAEETLYYPYCDCEDRSILFSRLIRDLLNLDVALIYYPGHLATAVCFNEDVAGDAIMIDGRKFTVCDPTYIGAPVGKQMPKLEYNKMQSIVLKR